MGAAPDDAEDLATQGCHGSLGTPWMSYALKMLARSPTTELPPRAQTLSAAPRAAFQPACVGVASPPSLSVLWRAGAQYPEVTAAADLDTLTDGLGIGQLVRSCPWLRLHHRVRQCLEVIGAVAIRIGWQPHDIPAARRGQPGRMLLAQVIAVRLHVRGQRAEHRGGVAVDVGQRVDGRVLARGARAATRTHPAHLAHITQGSGPAASGRHRIQR
jgi:hypothetical protein